MVWKWFRILVKVVKISDTHYMKIVSYLSWGCPNFWYTLYETGFIFNLRLSKTLIQMVWKWLQVFTAKWADTTNGFSSTRHKESFRSLESSSSSAFRRFFQKYFKTIFYFFCYSLLKYSSCYRLLKCLFLNLENWYKMGG